MRLSIYQIDAFADRVFGGNPAAVVPLKEWLPDATLQAIAAENNLAETAFFTPRAGGYDLRWFTPTVEIDLCGHATLASGWLLLHRLTPQAEKVDFETRSGRLTVMRGSDGLLDMDFPNWQPQPAEAPPELLAALGGNSVEAVLAHRDWIIVYADAAKVRALEPDMAALTALRRAVIATAPGTDGFDFVSRFFAPSLGIPEDPVTGSAHCQLAPYWADRLGKTQLKAYQASPRGGIVHCRVEGERVKLSGPCTLYLEGHIEV